MQPAPPTLHLMCGKIASGKSTLAARLGTDPGTVMIAEDDWLGGLFGDEIASVGDYVRCAAKLRPIMGAHVAALLGAGVSVVLDFPANTVETRQWMRTILEQTGASHVMHVLDVPDTVCLNRLDARNAKGGHAFAATREQFRRISSHYIEPRPEEGFHVVVHDGSGPL